jgi:23S rRNA (adenine2503-C2)-methyltransferase
VSQPPGLLVLEAPRRGKPPRHLSDMTLAERREAVLAAGLPKFRADQVSNHWFARLVDDPAQWTDIPAAMREPLAASLCPPLLTNVRDITCDGGLTVKSVWRLHDAAMVESVLMRYPATRTSRERVTVCVSSQAGCGMNCPFCATGQAGLTRNLSTAEIVEQVLAGARSLARGEVAGGTGRVSNVVFMGMGEPLANYKAVVGAVRRLIEPAPAGLGLSARGITVSTVGLVPRIRELATEHVDQRVARALLKLASECGKPVDSGILIDQTLGRQELAELAGTSMFTASRLLARWAREGVLEVGRQRVVVRSRERLEQLAGEDPGSR